MRSTVYNNSIFVSTSVTVAALLLAILFQNADGKPNINTSGVIFTSSNSNTQVPVLNSNQDVETVNGTGPRTTVTVTSSGTSRTTSSSSSSRSSTAKEVTGSFPPVAKAVTEYPPVPALLVSSGNDDVVQGTFNGNPINPAAIKAAENVPEPLRLGEAPVIKISQGELRPIISKSRGGREYFSFRGIPYAIPPVGNLRFKDAAMIEPWSGILNATAYGPSCIQYNIISENVEGEEDCLHLNIFTPKLPTEESRKSDRFPVMVFFHQGAFMFGTSSDFEEKYMMDENVVFVSVNYRLSVFGFLNTEGDTEAKGNQGLKDQVLALGFIRENIQYFNGDPDLVTIFGESAGASSVHYHMLSEMSRGLFHRGISMSGTALAPWAFTRSPRKMAKKLGAFMACPTANMSELFSCLQSKDANILAGKIKDLYEWNTDPITPFGPSIEIEKTRSSFMTQTPYDVMKNGQIADVPWMLGVVENVCLLDAWSILVNPEFTEDLNVDWDKIAPTTFMYKETALEPDAVSSQIKDFYFGIKEVGNDTARNLTNLYSDRYFNHGIRTSALMHVRKNEANQVYLYLFTYKGKQSHTQFAGISDILGVSEGDDLRYLFNTNRFDDIPLDSKDGDISQKFIKLWVSFARDGKPTEVWGGQEWKRVTAKQATGEESLKYYSLNDQCGFVDEPFSARLNFWDNLPLNEDANELYNPLHYKNHGNNDC